MILFACVLAAALIGVVVAWVMAKRSEAQIYQAQPDPKVIATFAARRAELTAQAKTAEAEVNAMSRKEIADSLRALAR